MVLFYAVFKGFANLFLSWPVRMESRDLFLPIFLYLVDIQWIIERHNLGSKDNTIDSTNDKIWYIWVNSLQGVLPISHIWLAWLFYLGPKTFLQFLNSFFVSFLYTHIINTSLHNFAWCTDDNHSFVINFPNYLSEVKFNW